MTELQMLESKIYKYDFTVTIQKKTELVWDLLINEINQWWLGDFRALGEESVISLDISAGGALNEQTKDGASLEWYRVQSVIPRDSIYLVGYMAPDWGGPTLSMLKLAVKSEGEYCVLSVSDTLMGNVSDSKAENAQSGWKLMFEDGFKTFAES